MDIKKIEKLIALIEKSNINEIEIKEGDTAIRITGNQNQAPSAMNPQQNAYLEISRPPAVLGGTQNPEAVQKPEMPEGKYIKSPMVGTFYHSASPGSEPFVLEGKSVKAGDTLCIIEAMKIMNQIEAETAGKILKIMVEDGNAVEYDQPLFIIGE